VVAAFLLTRADTLGGLLVPVFSDAALDLSPAVSRQPPDRAVLQTWVSDLMRTGEIPRSQGRNLQLNLDPASLQWVLFGDVRGEVLAASEWGNAWTRACLPKPWW